MSAPETTTIDTDKVKDFLALHARQGELETELSKVKEQKSKLEEVLLTDFAKSSCSSMKVNGSTVYLQRSLYANVKDGDTERGIAALESCGFNDLLQRHFNLNQVSALVREADQEGRELPPEFQEAFNVFEKFSVRVRKG